MKAYNTLKTIGLSLLLMAILPITAKAQKTEYSIHFGETLPVDSYRASKSYDGNVAWLSKTTLAGADVGINLGGKMKYNFDAVEGLGIIATIDIFYNGDNVDVENWQEDNIAHLKEEYSLERVSIVTPKYINIPVMIGINYDREISKNTNFWAETAIGVNASKITDLIINMPQVEDNDVIYTQHYKTMAGWAFQAGIGIKMADKISVGVHYNSLGSIKVKGKAELDGALANSAYIGSRFSLLRIYPSMFSIRLGYHF
jgi:opacity protein-like surface antigen